MPGAPDEQITVVLPRYQLEALLKSVPADAMSYTPAGIAVTAAYQTAQQALAS